MNKSWSALRVVKSKDRYIKRGCTTKKSLLEEKTCLIGEEEESLRTLEKSIRRWQTAQSAREVV